MDQLRHDPPRATAGASPVLEAEWGRSDTMRWITVLGVAGLFAAATMALFGLPPVDLHGPLHRMGIMDPFCGGTRAARLTAQGNLVDAWRYNPLGILATVAAGLATLRILTGVATRRWLNLRLVWTPRRVRVAIAIVAVATIALEIRQQMRADLLLKPY